MLRNFTIMALAALTLSGCADEKKDYDSAARCQGLGYKSGTAEYDKCVKDEKTIRLMEEQRKEYERMKQQDMDWKMRRY